MASTWVLPPRSVLDLSNRIVEVLSRYGIVRSPAAVEPFAEELAGLQLYEVHRRKQLTGTDGAESPMNILAFIRRAHDTGDLDEALWRAFLAIHFGSSSPETPQIAASAGRFLCAFSDTPTWTWEVVSRDVHAFFHELQRHRNELLTLRYANHRKYQSPQPEKIAGVIESFIGWAREYGGSPSAAFAPPRGATPEQAFHGVYHRFHVDEFGRLGAYDLLCLVGEMELVSIAPDSCYLSGATGPRRGAEKLCGPQAAGWTVKHLSDVVDEVARTLQVPYALMEDALCMWQKTPHPQASTSPTPPPRSGFIPFASIRRA